MEYWLEIEDVNSILVNSEPNDSEPNENHMHSCTYVLKYFIEFRLIKKLCQLLKSKVYTVEYIISFLKEILIIILCVSTFFL
jgi:hypothetical protein